MKTEQPMSGPVEVRHLVAFITLARARHFGRAAEELGLAQSTLSRTIAQLERLVGVPLLEPSRATITLSAAGRGLLPGATAALQALHRGVAGARRAQASTAVLGIVDSIGFEWLPRLRRELTARGEPAPELHQISLADGFAPLSDLVDVGIYPLPMVLPDGLRSVVLAHRQPWVALPANHRLADQPEIRLSDLRGEPAIAPPAHDLWDRNVELLLRAQDLRLALDSPTVSMYEVLALVAEGRGWTFTAALSNFHPWHGVIFRPVADVERFRVAAVWTQHNSNSDRVPHLVSAVRAAATHAEDALQR